jgi:AraC family transcriptional regulator
MADGATSVLDPESFYTKVTPSVEFRHVCVDEPDFRVMHSRAGPGGFEIDSLDWHAIVLQRSSAPFRYRGRIDGCDHRGWAAPGASWVMPAGARLSWQWEDPSEVLCLWLGRQRCERLLREGASGASVTLAPRFPSADPVLEHLVLALHIGARMGQPLGGLWRDALFAAVVAHLAGERLSPDNPATARGGLAAWRLRRINEYIEENLTEDIPLSELAGLAGLSEHHFSTAFRQTVGMPPHRYLLGRRIDRAKALLRRRESSITDVALSVGFSSSSHFTTMFRKLTGNTPRAFRQSV